MTSLPVCYPSFNFLARVANLDVARLTGPGKNIHKSRLAVVLRYRACQPIMYADRTLDGRIRYEELLTLTTSSRA